MYDSHFKEDRISVRATGPGIDVRTDNRGTMKNLVNPYVYRFFLPLAKLENLARGGKAPY